MSYEQISQVSRKTYFWQLSSLTTYVPFNFFSLEMNVLSFETCPKVPVCGGRRYGDGGLMEVDGRVVWGRGGQGGILFLDQINSEWSKMDCVDHLRITLAVCGGRLVSIGGSENGIWSKKVMELREGRWFLMSEMLIECSATCVLNFRGHSLVLLGGLGKGPRYLNDVQVFDGETQAWHRGPSLPQPWWGMSAAVHGDLVFVMGGWSMDRTVWCANIHDLVSH